MKLQLAIAFVVLASYVSVPAQSASSDGHTREQVSFGSEDDFQRAVPLPAAALQAILAAKFPDDDLERYAKDKGIRAAEIPATWFVASAVRLSQVPDSGLVVRAENACLYGAHIVPFWVLAKRSATYKVALVDRADALDVLGSRTNGYRNIQLFFFSGADLDYLKFCYRDGEYRGCGRRSVHHHLK
jgi:hypothetical protein